ncbi:element excision factor XisH family protein [Aerosakkonemataceae cyanobacterium BLCC-F154]|uniref:Element excision factor XisH family protein n=1 Tax=Floridaenema fluviatile BLCC-F154 TaxID=3153640 RepID=A0ABV4Y7X8_9CYAN
MPAKDIYHDAVKNALIKDGWTITADPYPIKYEEVKLFADLAGEKTISASRKGEQIIIEIKSFLSLSPMEKIINYQNLIKQILTEYERISAQVPVPDVDEVLMFDDERKQYLHIHTYSQ